MTKFWRIAWAGAVSALALSAAAPAQQLEEAVREAEGATRTARDSQSRIDNIEDRTGDIFREFRATLQRIDSQSLFVQQQRVYVESQLNELADLERQINEVDDITTSLLPMQFDMIDSLRQFINLDLPFLLDDRLARVERLETVMDDPNISPAERYRLILEAYQIEADYGRFNRTYEGPLGDGADAPVVDYLMIGRLAFVYLTQDDGDAGIWDAQAGDWRSLDSRYYGQIRNAIRVADGIASPDVMVLPVWGLTQDTAN